MNEKVRRLTKKIFYRFRLLFSTREYRRRIWPPSEKLTSIHLKNCRVIEDRTAMLGEVPKHGICAELGILKGDFSQQILEIVVPLKLHLVDIDPAAIEAVKARFKYEITYGVVEVHHHDSSAMLLSMPDNTFDWIYIDGDHSYEGVKRDLEAAHRKLKPDGLISLNDYIFFGSSDLTKYGVIEATHEFCIGHHYELIHLALNGRMYNDVTIRKIASA